MVQGQVFLKDGIAGGGGEVYLEVTFHFAKLCYVFEEKIFFLPP